VIENKKWSQLGSFVVVSIHDSFCEQLPIANNYGIWNLTINASCVEDFRFNDVTDDSLCHSSSTSTWINTRVRVDLRVEMVPFLQQFPMIFLHGYTT
jgi:hypothetical protein